MLICRVGRPRNHDQTNIYSDSIVVIWFLGRFCLASFYILFFGPCGNKWVEKGGCEVLKGEEGVEKGGVIEAGEVQAEREVEGKGRGCACKL